MRMSTLLVISSIFLILIFLSLRLEYGVDYSVGGFLQGIFGSNGVSVYFFDSCTQFHCAAAPFIVFAVIGKSAGRKSG